MAGNKFLIPNRSTLLKTKIDLLSKNLQNGLKNSSFTTQEQVLAETAKMLNELYKDLSEPLFDPEIVKPDDMPNSNYYNDIWNILLDDLIIVFSELENLETVSLTNFNTMVTQSNRLTSRLKSVSSKLGDYILYSTSGTKDLLYYKDSFNDLSKIDIGSSLLNTNECNVDQTQGIITLPVNTENDSSVSIKAIPIINPNSNGVVGNNQEVGAPFNGDLSVLLDNNPDTWFEYENVTTSLLDNKDSLVLDLTINLGESRIINYLRINPNNFGTKTIIQIDTIETSLDGELYTSIKDDIPIADFLIEDEENVFNLAPSTSKYAGQGIYTFTPRQVKYVHLILKQSEPYIINTTFGDRLRYAIGIRDIEIQSISYLNKGEIVSQPFSSVDEIKKVLLSANQSPIETSELGSVQYYISGDDGISWHEIQPAEFTPDSGLESVPEVLNFNTIDSDSINTAVPINTLRLKTKLIRNDDAFEEGVSSLRKKIKETAETHRIPTDSPFTIDLQNPPVNNSILVVDPMFGSRGLPDYAYYLNFQSTRLTTKKYSLPFDTLPRPLKKVKIGDRYYTTESTANEWVHVNIAGEEWTHTTDAFSTYGNTDKVYKLDVNTGILEFGDGTNGVTPDRNSTISIYFDAERIALSEDENAHLGKLDFATTNNKNLINIKRYDKIKHTTELLPKSATVVRLKNKNVINDSEIINTINALPNTSSKVDYQNGKDELVLSTDWSFDKENGAIYLASPTPDDTTRILSYTYQPIYLLSDNDWEWGQTDLLRDSVVVKESAWKVLDVEDEIIDTTVITNLFDLANFSVVPETVVFKLSIAGTLTDPKEEPLHPYVKEVPYIDGSTELKTAISKVVEKVPFLTNGTNNIVTLKNPKIDDTTQYPLTFSNTTIFNSDVGAGTPGTTGEYKITATGYEVFIDSLNTETDFGTVTYYKEKEVPDAGVYSVDYKNGKVYSQRNIDPDNNDPGSNSDWVLKVDYKYTDYRVEYPIARRIDSKEYKIDITNQSITFLDGEITKRAFLSQTRPDGGLPYYLVNYSYVSETRENITELQNYFTPVVKDFIIKVLPKGRIF